MRYPRAHPYSFAKGHDDSEHDRKCTLKVSDTKRILLVEDEESLHEGLKLNLELEGYTVSSAFDGSEAVAKAEGARFDLIVMDVMMPQMDGHKAAEAIRLGANHTPILFLTAKDAPADRVKGLTIGDDHLGKPFDLDELILRVKNLINRSSGKEVELSSDALEFNGNRVEWTTFKAFSRNGGETKLSKRQVKFLKLLASKEGQVVSRQEILEKAWGYDVFPNTRTIDNYVLTFRKLFEEDPGSPKHFLSVRGVGYQFNR